MLSPRIAGASLKLEAEAQATPVSRQTGDRPPWVRCAGRGPCLLPDGTGTVGTAVFAASHTRTALNGERAQKSSTDESYENRLSKKEAQRHRPHCNGRDSALSGLSDDARGPQGAGRASPARARASSVLDLWQRVARGAS